MFGRMCILLTPSHVLENMACKNAEMEYYTSICVPFLIVKLSHYEPHESFCSPCMHIIRLCCLRFYSSFPCLPLKCNCGFSHR